MFKDVNGKISIKRVMCFIIGIAAIGITVLAIIMKAGSEYVWPAYIAAGAMAGVTIGEKPKANDG